MRTTTKRGGVHPSSGADVKSTLHLGALMHARRRLAAPEGGRTPSPALVRALVRWFSRHARDLPWRRTRDPYGIWVSEVMLQQTQVQTVIPYWERWMAALPNIAALARCKSESLHKLWEGLGYYSRVRNLQRAAQQILRQHDGVFPENYEHVLALPGIGPYTAGAICSIAFHQPHPILDGNVTRVLARLFSVGGEPRDARTRARLWRLAAALVQIAGEQSCSELNQSLMELGALVCTPRLPGCEICPVEKFCAALKQRRVHVLPCVRRRPIAVSRRFAAFVVRKRSRFLVQKRPPGVVNAHLWEFPNVELFGADGLRAAAAQVLRAVPESIEHLCQIKHSITRYRITVDAFGVVIPNGTPVPTRGKWLTLAQLARRPFTSAHKKILNCVVAAAPIKDPS